MGAEPFARSISIDYSDDELDAISEAFTRRDIARRERAGDAHDPIRRAQNQTALRGLVARRAIMLGGTPARPRMTFLEPHATLLGAFLGANSIATIRREQSTTVRAVSLFVHGDVVVEQAAREGLAIQRMTAHGRDNAAHLLDRELLLPGPGERPPHEELELTKRTMTLTIAAIEQGSEMPERVPARAADILYARMASGSVTITTRDVSGTRSSEKWSWIDAGELGLWRVQTDADSPVVRLIAAAPADLAGEIDVAWRQATR
ncbi:MAG: hypothetical protein QOE11_911 [Solirubrobacteraceae bacterium]|jgi:hypothetical protein|nr:hypothetical protein [Solirubrobacteraceae bacterium]